MQRPTAFLRERDVERAHLRGQETLLRPAEAAAVPAGRGQAEVVEWLLVRRSTRYVGGVRRPRGYPANAHRTTRAHAAHAALPRAHAGVPLTHVILSAALAGNRAEDAKFASRTWHVTHVCGHKTCLKPSHLRRQSASANQQDIAYHAANDGQNRGTSRICWDPLQ